MMFKLNNEYMTNINGKFTKIPPFNDCLELIKERYNNICLELEKLKKENGELKSENWKDEEIQRIKNDYDNAKKTYEHGFPISEDEYNRIKEWMKSQPSNSTFYYRFDPTAIFTIGRIINESNGSEFMFRDANNG